MSRTAEKADEVLGIVAKKLCEPPAKPETFDNFGKHVAEQLRSLPKDQAIYLTKIINEGIFEAQCGALTKRSHIVTTLDVAIVEHQQSRENITQMNAQCQSESDPLHYLLKFNS